MIGYEINEPTLTELNQALRSMERCGRTGTADYEAFQAIFAQMAYEQMMDAHGIMMDFDLD